MSFGRTPDLVAGSSPEEYRDFFAAVFADLDANPRKTGVKFRADGLEIDVVLGNPVFRLNGAECPADFRGRWLPEHPVPLKFSGSAVCTFRLTPTAGNRVKISL